MYQMSPQWTLLLEEDQLVASAGADELYLVDEASPVEARALHGAWRSGQPGTFDALGAAFAPLLGKLEKLGALQRTRRPPGATLRFALRAPVAIGVALDALLETDLQHTDERDAELLVWVRASGTLMETLEPYATVRLPHLFVDLAYHHTISLGPLVWPGETACLGCLAGRIRHTWGDPEPPPAPEASTHVALAAALVREQLAEYRRLGSCPQLVERTVSFNVSTLATRTERVHRLPWCPWCFPGETPYGAGSFALPWARS